MRQASEALVQPISKSSLGLAALYSFFSLCDSARQMTIARRHLTRVRGAPYTVQMLDTDQGRAVNSDAPPPKIALNDTIAALFPERAPSTL